jgi:integral membrane protein
LNHGYLLGVRVVGFIEGMSAFVLFCIAMPMKYGFDSISEENLHAVGMTHGVLWMIYALVATVALCMRKISFWQYILLAFFSLLPLGPILADRWVLKKNPTTDNTDTTDKN